MLARWCARCCILAARPRSALEDSAIVDHVGHFDNEVDMAGLEGLPGSKVQNVQSGAAATGHAEELKGDEGVQADAKANYEELMTAKKEECDASKKTRGYGDCQKRSLMP